MKTKRIFSIIAVAALTISASAQQSAHDNYFGVSFGGGLNTMLYQPVNGQQHVGAGFDAGLFYARFFNKTVGLGVGAQYSWYNASALYNWSETTNGLVHVDNPGVTYNLTTGFNNWNERQNVGVISIPVEVLFRKSFNDRWSLIGGVGASLDLPIHGKYIAQGGTYTTTGVFPKLGNYVVENMPEHGFSTYSNFTNSKINNLATVGASVIGDLGARVAMNDNWGFYFGVYFGYGMTNLLKEPKTNPFLLINTTDPSIIDYAGTFDSNQTSQAKLLRCGLKIAFDFGWPAIAKEEPVEEQLPTIDEEAERLAREAAEREAAAKAAREAAEKAERERLAREQAVRDSIAAAEAAKAAHIADIKNRVEHTNFYYEINQTEPKINRAEHKAFDELIELMKEDKSMRILITGHTDNLGKAYENLHFYGKKRAEALKAYMVEHGVDASQIDCESKGQNEPIAPNDTREGRAKNRRANIKFL